MENRGNTDTVSYNYTGDTANQNNDRQVSMVYAFADAKMLRLSTDSAPAMHTVLGDNLLALLPVACFA